MRYFRVNNTVYFPVRVTKPSCPSPKYCPYLRGESPTTLLHQRDYLQTRVDEMENILNLAQNEISNLKNRISQLEEENQKLTEDLTQVKIAPFKKLFSKKQPTQTPRKRGAPLGHPGTSRKKPDSIDEYVTVTLQKCPDDSIVISFCHELKTLIQNAILLHSQFSNLTSDEWDNLKNLSSLILMN